MLSGDCVAAILKRTGVGLGLVLLVVVSTPCPWDIWRPFNLHVQALGQILFQKESKR